MPAVERRTNLPRPGAEAAPDPWGYSRTLTPAERRSLRLVSRLLLLAAVALALRLAWIQTVRRGYWLAQAPVIEGRDKPELIRPGAIYDRQMRVLAEAQAVADLVVDPAVLRRSEQLPEIRSYLLNEVRVDPARLQQALATSGHYACLAKALPRPVAEAIAARRLPGLAVQPGFRRRYLFGRVGSHLLGFYSADQRPLAGLELQYRFALQGRPGTAPRNVDAFGRTIVGLEGEAAVPAVPAKSLVTTLDLDAQRTVEAALDRLMATQRPETATAVVLEPATGAVLAMAARPTYNPNDISLANGRRVAISPQALTNLAAQWQYEPGSTFKVICLAAALEAGVVTPESRFYCGGTAEIGGRPLSCWGEWRVRGHGSLNLAEILAKSCNLGAAQVALRLGAERYNAFLERCGLGERTDVGLPGEARGYLYDPKSLARRDLANLGFGQHIMVTPLQLTAVLGAIANDGVYMQPHLVSAALNPDGSVYREMAPYARRRLCSAETSRRLREMLVGVVEHGTGRVARIPGVAVGGKTGTAQVWDPVTRSFPPDQSVVSFALMAPADRTPEFCILITAKNPQVGEHGAEVAAPAARDIALYLLRQRGLLPGTAPAARR